MNGGLAWARLVLLAGVLLSAGCAGSPKLTPEQVAAIETREVASPRDATLRAAAGVLMDRGMVIALSDHPAGLVAGRPWLATASTHRADARHPGPWEETVVWVRAAPNGRASIVRVQVSRQGHGATKQEEVTAIVADIEDRLMLAESRTGAAR